MVGLSRVHEAWVGRQHFPFIIELLQWTTATKEWGHPVHEVLHVPEVHNVKHLGFMEIPCFDQYNLPG